MSWLIRQNKAASAIGHRSWACLLESTLSRKDSLHRLRKVYKFYRKSDIVEYVRRKARIVDRSCSKALDVTLWNENAEKLGEGDLHKVIGIVDGKNVFFTLLLYYN